MSTDIATAAIAVAAFSESSNRLLGSIDGALEAVSGYRSAGGYAEVSDPEALIAAIQLAGLRGRGGAAFPMATKLRAVRKAAAARNAAPIVVANGEEGEPTSVKDRWLQRHRPHLILDGLRLAAHMVSAERGYVYVSDAVAAESIADALREAGAANLMPLPVEVKIVDPGYVAGEETAAVRALNGGVARPTDKPPRPFEHGVGGRPTLVSNVETLANLPYVLRHGAHAFRSLGTPDSPGTYLATLSVAGRSPILYELPYGTPLRDLLACHGLQEQRVLGLLMGGYFAGLLNRRALAMTLDHETARAYGSGLGCGALMVLTDGDCPVAVAASVMAYFAAENAGQCGSCFNGTAAMSAALNGLRDGVADADDVARLGRWSITLRGRGACGMLDGATNLAASVLQEFPQAVDRHLERGCDTHCGESKFRAARHHIVQTGALE